MNYEKIFDLEIEWSINSIIDWSQSMKFWKDQEGCIDDVNKCQKYINEHKQKIKDSYLLCCKEASSEGAFNERYAGVYK